MTLEELVIKITADTAGVDKGLDGISSKLGGIGIALGAATAAVATATVAVGKAALDSYADFEQLAGGVDKIFGTSADKVKRYAQEAYKSANVSANQYMEQVTSFSSSLLQSLGGDTDKAADIANQALIDMADNANTFGTSMANIQNAYQGFAKQNYTMLDNLKLGYGGTKTEMERLLADAQKLTGIKYDISNLADVYNAIHVIQEELNVTGTTAKEASTTISGSVNTMKAAWQNMLTTLMSGEGLEQAVNNLVDSVMTVLNNIAPLIPTFFNGLLKAIRESTNELIPQLIKMLNDMLPGILETVAEVIPAIIQCLVKQLPQIIDTIIDFIPQFVDAVIKIVAGIVAALPEIVAKLIPMIPKIVASLVEAIWNNFPTLLKAVIEVVVSLVKSILDTLGSLIEGVIDILRRLTEAMVDKWNKIKQFTSETWDNIKENSINMWTNITDGIGELVNSLKENVSTIWNNLKDTLSELNTNIKEGISQVWSEIRDDVSNFATNIWNNVVDTFNKLKESVINIFNGLKTAIKTPINGIIGFINSMISGICNGLNGAINALNKLSFDVPDWIPIIGGKKFGFNINNISAPQIPLLAKGGIIDQPTLAMIGEYADANRNPEIVAPQALLETIINKENNTLANVYMQVGKQIIQAIQEQDLSVQIGNDTIASAAAQGNRNYYRRTGKSMFAI